MVTNAMPQEAIPLRTIDGLFHILEVYPDQLVIKRTDVVSVLLRSDEVIPIKDLSAIRLIPSKRMPGNIVKMMLLLRDHRTVDLTYRTRQCAELRAMRALIEQQMVRAGIPVEPSEQAGCAE